MLVTAIFSGWIFTVIVDVVTFVVAYHFYQWNTIDDDIGEKDIPTHPVDAVNFRFKMNGVHGLALFEW